MHPAIQERFFGAPCECYNAILSKTGLSSRLGRVMHLIQFVCTGFRLLAGVRFEPSPGINVIVGDNAQGKTSLLEAILFSATARSHRTNAETELVGHGESWFQLRAHAARHDREVTLELNWWKGVKRFKVNGVLQTRVSDILGKLNVVLFSPEDVVLVKGSGANRRRFLDMELSQISPTYLNALQQYRQALRQRNELLRRESPDPELLDPWDAQLAQHGVVLTQEREDFVRDLSRRAAEAYGHIAAGERLSLTYQADVPAAESLGAVLEKTRCSDVRRGATTRGPHRDELLIDIGGRPARNFGSQGQQKTAALALRIAELELVRERTGEYPVLMLDEVLSELDERRSRLLFDAIDPLVQCLITTATVTKHPALLGREDAVYRIERGILEKQ